MADAAKNKPAAAQAYYTTSYAFGSGTTSTAALMVWRALSDNLLTNSRPLTGAELSEITGLTTEYIDNIFVQSYYQKHYGFRRFDTLAEWETWAKSTGVLYNPEIHGVPEVEEDDEAPADDFEDEEETDEE